MTILDEILDHKRREVETAKALESPEALGARARSDSRLPRGFRAALEQGPAPRVIAEIKRRSPSKGEIRPDLDPVSCARAYVRGGAAAISVLTDEHYFGGRLRDLADVRREVEIPLLRKDFVVDAYQIDEARLAGADAVLLITGAFPEPDRVARLTELRGRARGLGLDVLVEVHGEEELEAALASGADLLGINNRDLRTFVTDLAVTERLASRVPEGVVVVAESGIFTPDDIARLQSAGASAYLVGESLMRQNDVAAALAALRRPA
ncbi:indole-3-glycerol phosphate synthase TrpC [Myxococcota bacterium]|nr:indole-3-glycerol phosphate synthase TrpC [Myxococcota bacterium]